MPTERPLVEQVRALIPAGAQGLVTRYTALAVRLDVAVDLARDAIASLQRRGEVLVSSAGRQGVRLRLAAAASPAPGPGPSALQCPSCGMAVAADWRYCARCGKGLPRHD